MIKAIDRDSDFEITGSTVYEILNKLNAGHDEGNDTDWVYRPKDQVFNGYYASSVQKIKNDVHGEVADFTLDIVKC